VPGGVVFLVRHGDAGDRRAWLGDDAKRPLDDAGRRQAEGLVALLEGREIARIFSSPYVRCAQTVEPLAAARRLPVEHRKELAEGASRKDVVALIDSAKKADAVVLCTHGDVVEAVLGHESEKGSTWALTQRDGAFAPVEYLPPPSA
jgi:phosphohistidine phosphatase SixA